MWRTDLLIDAAESALRGREESLRDEQAVYGLDALAETHLHPVLAAGFAGAGLGVVREQPYPHEWRLKRRRKVAREGLPDFRDRLRCDLVLTPEPGLALRDPLDREKAAVRVLTETRGGLFESMAKLEEATRTDDQEAGVPPEEAYWLEVKLVGQFCYSHGVPGPNRTYASELRRTLGDLTKLDDDPDIRRAGLLLAIFTADDKVARHDALCLIHRCLDMEMNIGSPEFRSLPIRERIGNSVLTLCLIDIRKPEA